MQKIVTSESDGRIEFETDLEELYVVLVVGGKKISFSISSTYDYVVVHNSTMDFNDIMLAPCAEKI